MQRIRDFSLNGHLDHTPSFQGSGIIPEEGSTKIIGTIGGR